MYWIAKPFILPLQIFAFTKIKITFCKTRTKTGDSQGDWRLPSPPIVEKKHVHFPTVNSNSREKCIEYIFHDCFQNSREKWIGETVSRIYVKNVRQVTFFVFNFKTTAARTLILKSAIAIGGRATMMLLHALCVFLCTPLFEPK